MTTALVIVVILAVLVIAYGLVFDGRYSVEASIAIDRPPAEVFKTVLDLRSWPSWSPWLLHDRGCKLVYSETPAVDEVGGSYTWESAKIGAGSLTTVRIEQGKGIGQDIRFFKPFKSSASVTWRFEVEDEGSRVTWGMHGRMPFMMRWLASRMPGFIAKDYNAGLVLLRSHLDPEAPKMKLDFGGVVERPAFRCVGGSFTGTMAAMKQDIGENFPKLGEFAKPGESTALMACTAMDERKDRISVRYGVDPAPERAPEGWEIFDVPAGRYFKTTLTGSYDMLEHAYHHAFGETRMLKLRYDRSRHPYEVYVSDPSKAESPDLIETDIYLPVKS